MTPSTHPVFWRDESLPYIELRHVTDGHNVTYAAHSHKEWSIGVIVGGESTFLCADRRHQVSQGDIVIMNPNVVHHCNPLPKSSWAYYMMHIDVSWLASFLHQSGVTQEKIFQPTRVDTLHEDDFYVGFITLAQILMYDQDNTITSEGKDKHIKAYFAELFHFIYRTKPHEEQKKPAKSIIEVATYLDEHYLEDTSIEQLSEKFALSTGYLVRTFKKHFNLSPHAYRLNKRIQMGQLALKSGGSIIHTAQEVGFNDQSHFQRTFKQRVAATPKQYQSTTKSTQR
ncbi:AraC family transcriptional regulator [Marinomonas algicola]|uniref:AraC family transcriptional regulator n=1 Tax=Marinomonas algicola TaxID=2773454 RepID=UPI00174DF6AF|nr:AraC family transcriptional regulator [Marinomonas algicola]